MTYNNPDACSVDYPEGRSSIMRNPPPWRVIGWVLITALGVRLVWLGMMASVHDGPSIIRLFPDSIRYDALARCLLGEAWQFPDDVEMLPSDPLYRSGAGAMLYSAPGYPTFVFGVYRLFGPNPWAVLIVQAVLSAMSCALVSMLAWQLIGSSRVAWWAGLLASLSLTSCTLAAAVATETLFNTLFLVSLVLGIRGIRGAQPHGCAAAGISLALAGVVKPVVMAWVIVVIIAAVVYGVRGAVVRRTMGIASLMLVAPIILWGIVAWNNKAVYGVAGVAEMGTSSMRWMWTARALSHVEGTRGVREIQQDWRAARRGLSSFREAHEEDVRIVVETLRAHPWAMMRVWFAAVVQNCIAPDDLHIKQNPRWLVVWNWVDPLMRRGGVPILLAVGAGCWVSILRRGPRGAAWLMASIFLYFALLSGAAYWQGSRYLYPADAAVWIVLAWGVTRVYGRGVSKGCDTRLGGRAG